MPNFLSIMKQAVRATEEVNDAAASPIAKLIPLDHIKMFSEI